MSKFNFLGLVLLTTISLSYGQDSSTDSNGLNIDQTPGCSYNSYPESWSACTKTGEKGYCTQSRTSVPSSDVENDGKTTCAVGTQTRSCPCDSTPDVSSSTNDDDFDEYSEEE